METFLEKYSELIITLIGIIWAAGLWRLNKKDRDADTRRTDTDSFKIMAETLDKVTDDMADLSEKYGDLLSKIRARDEKIDELEKKFTNLKRDYDRLKRRNKVLMDQLIENKITPLPDDSV